MNSSLGSELSPFCMFYLQDKRKWDRARLREGKGLAWKVKGGGRVLPWG